MLGSTIAKCFEALPKGTCCQTDAPASAHSFASADANIEVFVSAQDARAEEFRRVQSRTLAHPMASSLESVRETSSSPSRASRADVPELRLGHLNMAAHTGGGNCTDRDVHSYTRDSCGHPPKDSYLFPELNVVDSSRVCSGRDSGRARPGLGSLHRGGGGAAQVLTPAISTPAAALFSPQGRESEIHDLHMMIASLQTRLMEAESMAKQHNKHEHNDPEQMRSLAAEKRARAADERAVMLGDRVKHLEAETQGMRAYALRSAHQMQKLQVREQQDSNTDFCFGPRRVCG